MLRKVDPLFVGKFNEFLIVKLLERYFCMNIPFEPLGTGGYRDVYRLSVTVTAFFLAYGQWPETLITNKDYLLDLFKKIPKEWHEPLLKRLRFEPAKEDNTLILKDAEGHLMDFSTAAVASEAQLGVDWLFSKPVKLPF